MTTDLEPIDPQRAVEQYLTSVETEVATSTLQSKRSRLKKFVAWCGRNDIDDMNQLSGRDVHEYSIHLRQYFEGDDGDGPAPMTLQTRLSAVRVFLQFCEDIDAVADGLADKVTVPTVDIDDRRRETIITDDDATHVVERLTENRYGTKCHVAFLLLWRTACRLGTLRSFDVDDVDSANNRIEAVHRPEAGTPLKNKARGERMIAVRPETVSAIEQYVDIHRPPVTDDHGRQPLLATRHGRPEKTTLRAWIHQAQLPCYHSNECPHGAEIQHCEYKLDKQRMHCPSTVAPHDVRRGAITNFLADDVPETAVSDRADVSKQTIDRHYDKRTPEQRSEQRRQYFE